MDLFHTAHLKVSRSRIFVAILLAFVIVPAARAEDTEVNEQAMAAYADAANFQTNGAVELAIEAWKKYLDKYPDEPLVSKAWHYLGVCYMQQTEPDYRAAADAFAEAVKDTKSELREESLVNLGWSRFAAAGEGSDQDREQLQGALDAFRTLIREKPTGKFVDRALFYAGEASYALGEPKEAVAYYDKLLSLDSSKESPLRCDTYYARGIALEDLGQFDDAMASYRRLLEGCRDNRLVMETRIRMGDASILQKQFDEAIKHFSEVAAVDGPDRPYALLRQAFATVQAGRPAEAAKLYEQLAREHPDSPYSGSAELAAAQAAYRAGNLQEAAKRFEKVAAGADQSSATEAAHWLTTIALRENDPQKAAEIAARRLKAGVAGPFAVTLKLDLAEATMLLPGKTEEALQLYREVYEAAPDAAEAPRALYNAAFAALQLGRLDEAARWSQDFQSQFPDAPLVSDVQYIAAETKLLSNRPDEAAKMFVALVSNSSAEQKMQLPLWALRGAVALSASGRNDDAIKLLADNRDSFSQPDQRAEAHFLAGSFHLAEGRGEKAADFFQAAIKAAPQWYRAAEAHLQLGQARLVAGDDEGAIEVWKETTQKFSDQPVADQAIYRTAQTLSRRGDHQAAADQYARVLTSQREPALIPASLYGRGWNLMRDDRPADALKPLDQLIEQFPEHPLSGEATLARGMCLRVLGRLDEAAKTLEAFLAKEPEGDNRGHALYELALIEQDRQRHDAAAERLETLVSALPDYPAMDKVLYELAWSLKESGEVERAEKRFRQLIEQFPEDPLTAEGRYFVGSRHYDRGEFEPAAESYESAANVADDEELKEKSVYRRGWSLYKANKYAEAGNVFATLAEDFQEGRYYADALFMIGESHFKRKEFEEALAAYRTARERIEAKNESEQRLEDNADRQVRALVLLHGGQSLAQLERWEDSLDWYQELEKRFPGSEYLAQAKYESAYALQQLDKTDEALAAYAPIAENERNEIGARSRFMMGEIHFAREDFPAAISEFQRVMYGYGADAAPEAIRNWQAKSGYEAGRCAEMMIAKNVNNREGRRKAAEIATRFFSFVVEKHPKHALAPKAQERLEVLQRMGLESPSSTGQNSLRTGR